MFGKSVRVILSKDAREVYEYLNREVGRSKIEGSILRAIGDKTALIKDNPHYGDVVPKRLIPKEYGVDNLFRVELPNFWRMLYSLEEGENRIEIIAFVLDIVDHKKYNKRFGYN